MDSFLFSVNNTMPVFLVILLGWFLQRIGIIGEGFAKEGVQYVFKCALPVNLFNTIISMDIYGDFDLRFCAFCFGLNTLMFLGFWGLFLLLIKDRAIIGGFTQAAVRSSIGILGIAFLTSIYGDSSIAPMMIISCAPFSNVYSVIILSLSPQTDENGNIVPAANGSKAIKQACINVARNPIILGILLGLPFALLQIKLPVLLNSAIKTVGSTATPVALLAIGASFSGREALSKLKPASVATLIRLVILPLIALPAAVLFGLRGPELVAVLLISGAPTATASYAMAKNMRADAVLTSNTIVLTTLFSSVTLTFWLFLLRARGLI